AWNGDVEGALKTVGTVHYGGLVQVGAHASDSCQVDDGSPADLLPDAAENEQREKGGGRAQDLEGRQAVVGEDVCDESEVDREHIEDQPADNHPGDEVGEVADRLDDALVPLVGHLVEEERQDDWRRED